MKRLTIKPGASLSLQLHHHRAEHWIVVKGTARVVRGDESFLLTENESTFIPLGVKHRLKIPAPFPSRSSRSNRAVTWAKTISSGSKTATTVSNPPSQPHKFHLP